MLIFNQDYFRRTNVAEKAYDLGKGASVSFTEEKGLVFKDGTLMESQTVSIDSEQARQLMIFLSLPPQRQELLEPVINPHNY